MFREAMTEGVFDTAETGARNGMLDRILKRIESGKAGTSRLPRSRTTGKTV
jgi:hypothetical protein